MCPLMLPDEPLPGLCMQINFVIRGELISNYVPGGVGREDPGQYVRGFIIIGLQLSVIFTVHFS